MTKYLFALLLIVILLFMYNAKTGKLKPQVPIPFEFEMMQRVCLGSGDIFGVVTRRDHNSDSNYYSVTFPSGRVNGYWTNKHTLYACPINQ